MPMDPDTISEAQAIVAKNGMADFVPTSAAPHSIGGEIVPVALIDPVARNPGTPNFNKPDRDRPDVVRSDDILSKIRNGVPLDPLLLLKRPGEHRYALRDGFHRLHLCAALGYTHIHAEVLDRLPWE